MSFIHHKGHVSEICINFDKCLFYCFYSHSIMLFKEKYSGLLCIHVIVPRSIKCLLTLYTKHTCELVVFHLALFRTQCVVQRGVNLCLQCSFWPQLFILNRFMNYVHLSKKNKKYNILCNPFQQSLRINKLHSTYSVEKWCSCWFWLTQ